MSDQSGAAVPPSLPRSLDTSKPVARMVAEVRDALDLLDYAVAAGVKTKDGLAIATDIMTKIKITATKLGLMATHVVAAAIVIPRLARPLAD